MGLSNIISHFKKLDAREVMVESIKDNEEVIITINQHQMYEDGTMDVTNPGSMLQYADSTIAQKKRKAEFPRTDHITLRWTGELYEKMKVIIFEDRFVVTTTDLKWANFLEPQSRFGKALGLTEESIKVIREEVRRSLKKLIWK